MDKKITEVNRNCNRKKPIKTQSVPRGNPKSKRLWKTPKTKFSNIKKSMPRLSCLRKLKLRQELLRIKEHSRLIKEERKRQVTEHHKRRAENLERRLKNERRAEIVQIIKNPSKIKRMKKKQLRMIKKSDLSDVKTV